MSRKKRFQETTSNRSDRRVRRKLENNGALPKFNVAPEKWWLEDYSPFRMVYFQGLC